ncbi:hypothetical protein GQ457_11G023310 [Hibiscus cannabinus]
MWEKLERLYGKEEKKYGAPSCANLLQSSKVKLESLTKEQEIISNNSSCHIMAKCSHCHYHGHSLHNCPIKKRKSYRIRQVWVPKGTRDIEINVNGSKAIWIPKSKLLSLVGVLEQMESNAKSWRCSNHTSKEDG